MGKGKGKEVLPPPPPQHTHIHTKHQEAKDKKRNLHKHADGAADTRDPVDKGNRHQLWFIEVVPVLGPDHRIDKKPPSQRELFSRFCFWCLRETKSRLLVGLGKRLGDRKGYCLSG